MNEQNLSIKVCGITRQSDLSTAMGMGAHFCGFIFHPKSPRYISPERAGALHSALIKRVGVFVNADAEEILETIHIAGLDYVQLHGDQDLECARKIGSERVIRVLWPETYESLDELRADMERWSESCSWFLLDAGKNGGGHGRGFDWLTLSNLNAPRPWFLAGGLSSDTLKKALTVCHPDGIDLNSGVEAIPGQKCPQKLLASLKVLLPFLHK